MRQGKVASRYAKSLIGLAREKNLMAPLGEDMKLFVSVFNQNPILKRTLDSPIIDSEKKLNILNQIFKGKVNEVTILFFTLVLKKNREQSLEEIAKEYSNIEREINGVIEAEITTTFPLTPAIREDFKALIAKNENNSKIELIEKIDKSILGGYILKVEDRQIDESVLSKLNLLRNKFKDNSYISKY